MKRILISIVFIVLPVFIAIEAEAVWVFIGGVMQDDVVVPAPIVGAGAAFVVAIQLWTLKLVLPIKEALKDAIQSVKDFAAAGLAALKGEFDHTKVKNEVRFAQHEIQIRQLWEACVTQRLLGANPYTKSHDPRDGPVEDGSTGPVKRG